MREPPLYGWCIFHCPSIAGVNYQMFTYINPEIRSRLIAEGKLIRINSDGECMDAAGCGPVDQRSLSLLGPVPLPLMWGEHRLSSQWYASVRSTELTKNESLADVLREQGEQHFFPQLSSSMVVNSVLVIGNAEQAESPLVRVHSNCLTGDVFGSCRCECGPQLEASIGRLKKEPEGGYLVYMAGHEGRGIGLWAKAATYVLQDGGEDTYQANRSLGLPDDSRDFSDAATLLKYFGRGRALRLMTNNPKKVSDLQRFGLENIEPVKHVSGVNDFNMRYMRAKLEWGHDLDEEDLQHRPG